jgi:hypothetical protein
MLRIRLIACLASVAACATARNDAQNDPATTTLEGSTSTGEASTSTADSVSASASVESSSESEGSSDASTGSSSTGCGLPEAIDLSAAFPLAAQWRVEEASIGASTTFAEDQGLLSLWLNEGYPPFADGFTAVAIDLGDVAVRPGAGLSVSEKIGTDTYRGYLATSGTLVIETFEAPAEGSIVAGRWEAVILRELEADSEAFLEGGCAIELTDAAFELSLEAIEGGETAGPG